MCPFVNRFSGSVYDTWRNQAGTNESDVRLTQTYLWPFFHTSLDKRTGEKEYFGYVIPYHFAHLRHRYQFDLWPLFGVKRNRRAIPSVDNGGTPNPSRARTIHRRRRRPRRPRPDRRSPWSPPRSISARRSPTRP